MKLTKRRFVLSAVATLFAVSAHTASAETPEQKGLAIAKEAKARSNGYGDSVANLKMILRDRRGRESIRNVRIKSLEVEGDGDRSLTIFDEPADVKGTTSLTWSHAKKADEQWLYLPALKRVKRISSKNKSGPFMGSEFSFEDIAEQQVEKYTYKFLRDETIDGKPAFVNEQYPSEKHSGYTKQIVWLEKDRYVVLKTEFYDRKGSLLKTLKPTNYKQYDGRFWRASKQEMVNHRTGKSTVLEFSNYDFNTGLRSADFSKNAIKR